MVRNTPKFDDGQAMEIRKKYEAGGTVEGLAQEYNTTGSTICRTIRRIGGTIRTAAYYIKMFNDEEALELREKYEAGATLQDLVDEYGSDKTLMSRTIQRVGGTIRPRGYAKGTKTRRLKKAKKGILSWVYS